MMPFAATWMDLEAVRLDGVRQEEEDEDCMVSLICSIYTSDASGLIHKQN